MRARCRNMALYGMWLVVLVGLCAPAYARNMEGHQLYLGLGLGPGVRLPSDLGASPAELMVLGQVEYALSRRLSGTLDLTLGASGTVPLMAHLGAKGRLHDLGLALSPYGLVQFGVGGLLDVMGVNLPWVGARLGIGADYFVTRRTMTGVGLYFDLGGTTGERPAFYGLVQLVLTAAFNPIRPHTTTTPPAALPAHSSAPAAAATPSVAPAPNLVPPQNPTAPSPTLPPPMADDTQVPAPPTLP